MIKKMLTKLSTSATVIAGILCFCGMAANATTVEDVVATAIKYGIPDSAIQQGINQYYEDPDTYSEEDFDETIAYIEKYHQDIIDKLMGTTTSGTSSNPQTTTQAAAPGKPSVTVTPDNNTGSTGSDRINESDFIDMTLDQKQDYVSSLSPDQQRAFIDSLTPDELKSIVKQLPVDDKVEVMNSFVDASDSLGVKVTIDEISDESVSMTLRNKDGELIDVTSIGVIIEETGFDYRLLFALSGTMFLAAAGGIWYVVRKCFFNKENEVENGQE